MISHKDLLKEKRTQVTRTQQRNYAVKYVFAIKPEIKEWLETGHFPSAFNKKVYQLLEIEHKIMDALNKLEDS